MTCDSLKIGPLRALGIGKTINVAWADGMLLAIQTGAYPSLEKKHHGRLLLMDPEKGVILGQLDGIGSARQICVQDHIAYITSREDGLFIVDIHFPAAPRLLCHYDTCEYATGVCAAGEILAVSLRTYGIELIDISHPAQPRFISLIRTGEAQSVWIDGSYVYAGVWGSKELVIASIQRPEAPEIVCRFPLDGRGDGVTVRRGLCFAATGQHARPPQGMDSPPPETYERLGNGLEILDVRDPAHPIHLSTVKFPPYYGLTFDMWSVRLSGSLALVSNTRNGFFIVDAADPRAPRLLKRVVLPDAPEGGSDAVGGFDFHGDQLYLAGAQTDAYALSLSMPLPEAWRPETGPAAPAAPWDFKVRVLAGSDIPFRRVLAGHHVQSVADAGDALFAACGTEGVLLLDKQRFETIQVLPTQGSANTVLWRPPVLYVAEGLAGLAVYRREENGEFTCTCRYSPYGRGVYDLQFSGDGQTMLLQCASLGVIILDAREPEKPVYLAEQLHFIGLFYGRHFPARGFQSKCFLGCNRDGLFELEMQAGQCALRPLPTPGDRFGFSSESGMDVTGDQLLVNSQGGYFVRDLNRPEEIPALQKVEGVAHYRGKPRIFGQLLVTTERAEGIITFCCCGDLHHIQAISQMETTASPDLAVADGQNVYIPGGRQGLLIFERPF